MYGDQIAKSWGQFVAKVISLRSFAPDANAEREGSNSAAPILAGVYEETRTTPYTPDNHDKRIESSLHLSC